MTSAAEAKPLPETTTVSLTEDDSEMKEAAAIVKSEAEPAAQEIKLEEPSEVKLEAPKDAAEPLPSNGSSDASPSQKHSEAKPGEVAKKPAAPAPPPRTTPPFLMRVFLGQRMHRDPREFRDEKNSVVLHTWKDATLRELTYLLADHMPEIIHSDARLSFRSVFPDPAKHTSTPSSRSDRSSSHSRPNSLIFHTKDLAQFSNADRLRSEDQKTLEDLKFVIGDMLDIAVVKTFSIVGAGGGGMGGMNAGAAAVPGARLVDRLGRRSSGSDRAIAGANRNGAAAGPSRYHPYGPGGGGSYGHDDRGSGGRGGGRMDGRRW
ncbi:hypothetical protein HDU98_009987 [Podochytrium sp. JEL0797]|nr:hypothetical protein HDU98_009987 [Podochytrium sp. JEL0797]